MRKLIFGGLFIIWMVTVFVFSSQPGNVSNGNSVKIVQIVEHKKVNSNGKANMLVRKSAHFFMYAIGGVFAMLLLSSLKLSKRKAIIIALSICLIYAFADEFHQIFVSGRTAQLSDVLIDFSGAVLGVSLVCLFRRIFH